MDTDPVSETLFFSLIQFRTIGKLLKPSDFEVQNGFTVHLTSHPNGQWESKCGWIVDILHIRSPDAILTKEWLWLCFYHIITQEKCFKCT
jgi:hypothetical protein